MTTGDATHDIQSHPGDRRVLIHGDLCVCLSELLDKFPREKVIQNQQIPFDIMTLYTRCLEIVDGFYRLGT